MQTLALLGPLGGWEIMIIALVGLLIFGKRLPEVGRSIGRGIVEFKKGLQGIEDDISPTSTMTGRPSIGTAKSHSSLMAPAKRDQLQPIVRDAEAPRPDRS